MNPVKVEGSDVLVRDADSSAIINSDEAGYRNFMAVYNEKRRMIERINTLEEKVQQQDYKLDKILELLSRGPYGNPGS